MFGSTDPKIVSGLATWAGILIVIAVVHWMTRRQAHRWAAAEAGSDGSVRSVQSV